MQTIGIIHIPTTQAIIPIRLVFHLLFTIRTLHYSHLPFSYPLAYCVRQFQEHILYNPLTYKIDIFCVRLCQGYKTDCDMFLAFHNKSTSSLFIFLSRLHNSYFISTHNKNISIIKFLLINLFSVIVAI